MNMDNGLQRLYIAFELKIRTLSIAKIRTLFKVANAAKIMATLFLWQAMQLKDS